MFSDLDIYLFREGKHNDIYGKLGAHPRGAGKRGFHFALWAPHARAVSVLGDWNGWDPAADPMERGAGGVIFECDVPRARAGQYYKYEILTADGRRLIKADPWAFFCELRPGTASRLYRPAFRFTDARWMKEREGMNAEAPVSVYELHPGSWRRHEDGSFYRYTELAEALPAYVKSMGYTHVEFMGIPEHPLDASWGYQVTGYYAPTSRYGTPDEFKQLVNTLHQSGIGVILDWVPAHFPRDSWGLAEFDGEPLFEHPDPRRGDHPDWGTKVFNYGSPEVCNFLLGSALHWLKEYHVDGLRVDAVSSMLYLDYGRKAGEWLPNVYGGRENLEAIGFLSRLNETIRREHPGVLTIAEESTAWEGITRPTEYGGLGFSLKWNMGWMHDFLEYMSQDPLYRKFHHNRMTFAISYAASEEFMLVISHDEVVHLKRSLFGKMPGYDEDKLRNLKCGLTFMFGHPGKKLLFMGQDMGQHEEWSEDRELPWSLLEQPEYRALNRFAADLLRLYRETPALYRFDDGQRGFRWINPDDGDRSIFSFERFAPGSRPLVFVINFTPVDRDDYRVGVRWKGRYQLILDQDRGLIPPADRPLLSAFPGECDGQPYHLDYPLKGFGAAIFRKL